MRGNVRSPREGALKTLSLSASDAHFEKYQVEEGEGCGLGPPFARKNRNFRLKLDAARWPLLDSSQFKTTRF